MTKQEQIKSLNESLRRERDSRLDAERRLDTTRNRLLNRVRTETAFYKGETITGNCSVRLLWLRERVIAGNDLGYDMIVRVQDEGKDTERLCFDFVKRPEVAP